MRLETTTPDRIFPITYRKIVFHDKPRVSACIYGYFTLAPAFLNA